MNIDDDISLNNKSRGHKVCNHFGNGAVGFARERPVHIATINRRRPLSRTECS